MNLGPKTLVPVASVYHQLAAEDSLVAQRRRTTPHEDAMQAAASRSAMNHEVSQSHAGLMEAFTKLPDDLRVPIQLAYVSGMSREAIAKHCGVPIGTIKTRIRRGILTLQESLNASANSVNVGAVS
jgi:RNA polymerase sigma factor (sigma-70 family)